MVTFSEEILINEIAIPGYIMAIISGLSLLITSLLFAIGYIGILRKLKVERGLALIPFCGSFICCKKAWGKGAAIVLLIVGIIATIGDIYSTYVNYFDLPFTNEIILTLLESISTFIIEPIGIFYTVWKIIYTIKLGKLFYKNGGLVFLFLLFLPVMLIITGYNKTKLIENSSSNKVA